MTHHHCGTDNLYGLRHSGSSVPCPNRAAQAFPLMLGRAGLSASLAWRQRRAGESRRNRRPNAALEGVDDSARAAARLRMARAGASSICTPSFPIPKADPALPASYDFAGPTNTLPPIRADRRGIVYRLGESIEHDPSKHLCPSAGGLRPLGPPRASASFGITTKAGPTAFSYDIRYWEIWNEPENRPAMWSGTDEDYFRLYATAAQAIKKRNSRAEGRRPGGRRDAANCRRRVSPDEFCTAFSTMCRNENAAARFLLVALLHRRSRDSSCASAKRCAAGSTRRAIQKTELISTNGIIFPATTGRRSGAGPRRHARQRGTTKWRSRGAAFVACVAVELQDSPVDVANFFHGDSSAFGLFTQHGEPREAFYAFLAFRRLLHTPHRVAASGGSPGELAFCAGLNKDKTRLGVLLVNYRAERRELSKSGSTTSPGADKLSARSGGSISCARSRRRHALAARRGHS